MTTPFWCLFIGCVIPYVLAPVAGYYKTRQFGTLDNKNPRAQTAALEGTGARAAAAQSNAWEALAIFTVAVLVNHAQGGDPGTSATLALMSTLLTPSTPRSATSTAAGSPITSNFTTVLC